MRKLSKRMLQVSSALGLILTTSISKATECTPAPDCASLGYSKTATDCEGLASIKCPFDTSKLYCTASSNQDENAPIAIGDIVYSDGTYANPDNPQPTKTPIGVIYNSNGGYFVALDDFGGFAYPATLSCSGYTTGVKNWSVPTETQLKEMYNNKTKLNETLNLLASAKIDGFYIYKLSGSKSYYIDMNTGQALSDYPAVTPHPTRCVNTLANMNSGSGTTPTPEPIKYKVGDTYMKDGIAMGTVVQVDSTGQHGTVAISRGKAASSSEANTTCNNTSAGGLLWSLPTCRHYCLFTAYSGSGGNGYSSDCGYCSCRGTNETICYNSTASNLAVVCSAPF